MRLSDVATIALNFPDADFWLQRGVGLELGRPTKTFSPKHIGIKVHRTDILLPQYLYYVFEHLWTTGAWSERAPTVSIVKLMVLQPTGGGDLNELDETPRKSVARSTSNKDMRKLIRQLEAQGVRVEMTKGGHIAIYAPGGIVHASSTPSDRRTFENMRARLRRYGVSI